MSPVSCISLLSLSESPKRTVDLYRELRNAYSESMTPIIASWNPKRGAENNSFLKAADFRLLEHSDYEKLQTLEDLSYAVINARRRYQESLLDLFSTADGDLPRIARVSARYEKRFEKQARGNIFKVLELTGRESETTQLASELLVISDSRRAKYINSNRDIEAFTKINPKLKPWVNEEIFWGVPTFELSQKRAARQIQWIMNDERKTFKEALQAKITALKSEGERWALFKKRVEEKAGFVATSDKTKILYERAASFAEAQEADAMLALILLRRLEVEQSPEFAALSEEGKAYSLREMDRVAEDQIRKISQLTQREVLPRPLGAAGSGFFTGFNEQFYF